MTITHDHEMKEVKLHKDTLRWAVKYLIKEIKENQKEAKEAFSFEDVQYYNAKSAALIDAKIKLEGHIKHAT